VDTGEVLLEADIGGIVQDTSTRGAGLEEESLPRLTIIVRAID